MALLRPDLELAVLRAQAGDAAAFGRLVEQCHGVLLRHARRYLADAETAADAVQEAWCAIVRGLDRLDDPARFVPWALGIVSRRAIDLGRRRRLDARVRADLAANAALTQAPGDAGDGSRLRAAVAALDLDHRLVVELHYLDGLTLGEVADALGLPAGTVKSRAFHARRRLRHALQRFASDPQGAINDD